MAERNCPQCNFIINDNDTICPSCGMNLEEQRTLLKNLLSLFTHSQFENIKQEGRTNKEILDSLSDEEKKQAYIFADLNFGKFPWEVSLDNEPPEMPEAVIIYPDAETETTQTESEEIKRPLSPPQPPPPPPTPKPKPRKTKKEKAGVLLFLLSLFVPLVGIFYFFSANSYRPRKAKFALAGGIIGLVICVAVTVLIQLNMVPENIYSAVFGGILNLFR